MVCYNIPINGVNSLFRRVAGPVLNAFLPKGREQRQGSTPYWTEMFLPRYWQMGSKVTIAPDDPVIMQYRALVLPDAA